MIGAEDLLNSIDRAADQFAEAVAELDFDTAERWALLAFTALETGR